MKSFLKDWRNPALLTAVVLVIVLGIVALAQRGSSTSAQLAQVGSHVVTQGELQQRLKARHGDAELMKLVNARVIDEYATSKGLLASTAEIDQLVEQEYYAADLQDVAHAKYLEQMGKGSEEQLREDLRSSVLQVKLTLPEEELRQVTKALLQQSEVAAAYTRLPRYRFRLMRVMADRAGDVVAGLEAAWNPRGEKKEDFHEVLDAMVTADGSRPTYESALTPHIVALASLSEDAMKKSPAMKALATLEPGKCAKLDSSLKAAGELKTVDIVQLVEKVEGVRPTYENSSILIGQLLISSQDVSEQTQDPRLRATFRQLQSKCRSTWGEEFGKAIRKAGVTFYTSDYPNARERFAEMQKSFGAGK